MKQPLPPKRKTSSQKGRERGRRDLTGVRPASANRARIVPASGPEDQKGDRRESTLQMWHSIPRHIAHSSVRKPNKLKQVSYNLKGKSNRKRRVSVSDLGFEAGVFCLSLPTWQGCYTGMSQEE